MSAPDLSRSANGQATDLYRIRSARPEEMDAVRGLFQEYAEQLGFSLCFQNFAAELAALPGQYAEPSGALLLAELEGQLVGCVAVRDSGHGWAEMKRLYVRPTAQGNGLGRKLALAAMAEAQHRAYQGIRLDTVSGTMDRAIALYRNLGFAPVAPYVANPLPGVLYLGYHFPPGGSPGKL